MTIAFDEAFKTKALILWNKATIRSEKAIEATHNCQIIINNKSTYKKVEIATKIPWWFVAILHGMESDFNFQTWLANGDPLGHDTVQVPKGLHCDGTWVDAAIISLKHDRFVGITDWTIEHCLYLFEAWNGWGYSSHGVNSSYVWAGTSEQQPGRYVADHVWDANAISKRCGCVAMLKSLINMKQINIDGKIISDAPVIPIPDNPRNIVLFKINELDSSDVRGFDAAGKVVCWLDSEHSLEKLYYGAVAAGAPRARFITAKMDKKPAAVPK